MILDLIREKLRDKGLSEDDMVQTAGKIELLILARILEATEAQLAPGETSTAENLLKDKDLRALALFLRSKYEVPTWRTVTAAATAEVLAEYAKEVLDE